MSVVAGHYAQRVLSTVFLISLGIYLFLATVTYTPFDPGWMHVSSETVQVSNASGVAGAWVADMLYGILGWAALLLPFFLFMEAIQVWWPRSYLIRPFRYAAEFFILLTTAALLYFLWQVPNDALVNASGGIIGYELGQGLANILTQIGAIVFLVLFCLTLWTLAFKIEWLKTGQFIRAIPSYLQDLFYKNVPPEADVDLTLEQHKPVSALQQDIVEHSESPVQHVDTEQKDTGIGTSEYTLRELEPKIAAQPKVVEPRIVTPEPVPQVTVNSGEVWRAVPEPEPQQESEQIDAVQPIAVVAGVQHVPDAHDEIAQLIEEADRHLQDVPERRTQQPIAAKENTMLDWNDDQIFDELLAAVPQNQQPIAPEPMREVVPQQEIVEDQPVEQEHEWHSAAITPSAMVEEKQPEQLTKEEFIEAWQETAGKHEADELDWDDLDAPLTDSSGRVISRAMQVAAQRRDLPTLPSLDLLDRVDLHKKVNFTNEQLSRLSELLEIKLQDFNIKAKVIEAQPGPVVTRFELDLAPGVKASKVTNISRDLARSMSMASVRVVEVIAGKPYIGIEVPNSTRETVRLIELLDIAEYRNPASLLTMAMGKDIAGQPVLTDLTKAPHMLIAGQTGSGKSVTINAMLLSLLLKYTPEQLRLILIDPKIVELAVYSDIPHLLTPVVTEMKDAVNALNWAVNEMERRYELMKYLRVRKMDEFNRKVKEALANGEDLIDPTWKASDSATQERAPRLQPLPLIVIVADEFADMIMQVGKKAEELINRLAAKARAAGIHLMLATQRPSADVVTGLIKANIPARVALRVDSAMNSRIVLDAGGAENLLGNGDMLFLAGSNEPNRVHSAYVSDDEVNRICDAWRERGSPNYVDEILMPYDEDGGAAGGFDAGEGGSDRDMLYDQCVSFVLESRKVSVSSLQRKFSLGYNRAARIVDQMEENGVVSPMGANGKRDILV